MLKAEEGAYTEGLNTQKNLLISPLRELLQPYKLILASHSPRRKQLLEQIGFDFTVEASPFQEDKISKGLYTDPSVYLKVVATGKAMEVAKKYVESPEPVIVIGADTVIVHDDSIIGKPHLTHVAKQTLRRLSGQQHWVHTGVALMVTGGRFGDGGPARSLVREAYFESKTLVKMCELDDKMIDSYVESGEPLDKAGAYAIQGVGSVLIQYINGEYSNVVGLPLNGLCTQLTDFLQVLQTTQIR